jgi:hypothetical protein
MLERSPKPEPKLPTDVVISPRAAQWFAEQGIVRWRIVVALRWRKGRIVTAAAWRQAEYRQRKNDRIRCYPSVRMKDSDVYALLLDYEMGHQHDNQSLSPRQLREKFDKILVEVAGPVIAAAAISAIKRKK